jgi:hypothetical protein
LNTLNRDSLRTPLALVGLEDLPTVPCLDSVTISTLSTPPAPANFVVISATQDTVPSLDSPGASHIWIQEAIVREGQHVIGTNAGPNGAIGPQGPIVVADGANQTFTITAVRGYHVADVSIDGHSIGVAASYTFSNVTSDHLIAATFASNDSLMCGGAYPEPDELWPPDHKMVAVQVKGVADPDGDPVTMRITRVTQNEPEGGVPSRPDAIVNGTDTCLLRAERAGTGIGRRYTLWYTATDGHGQTCDGSVEVCVPHDRDHANCGGVEPNHRRPARRGTSPLPSELVVSETHLHGSSATVAYTVGTSGPVQLALYDVAGRRVVTIVDESQPSGEHEVAWDAHALARGIYFYRLRAMGAVAVKMVSLR